MKIVESEAIEEAYMTAVKELWGIFFDAMVVSNNSESQRLAYERFLAGLAVADQARRMALKGVA